MVVSIICFVPVNLYGPYDNFNPENSHLLPGLMHRFHNSKLNNHTNYIAYGTGIPLRQMLYGPDFANIILDVLLNKPEIKNETIICCNNNEYSIHDIVLKLSLSMDIPFDKVVWDNSKSDGCLKKTVSNEKFKQYYPNFTFTTFENGMKEMYEWYTNNINNLRI